MLTSRGPLAWLTAFLARLGVCGNAGVAVGIVTGLVLTLLDLIEGPLGRDDSELVVLWLIPAVFGWLLILFLCTVFARWTAASVTVPALVNSVLVTGLTVLVCRVADLFSLAWLVGLLVGILVGYLLCSLYKRVTKG